MNHRIFRLERSPGGIRTHWKAPPLHGAHPEATLSVAEKQTFNVRAEPTPRSEATGNRERAKPARGGRLEPGLGPRTSFDPGCIFGHGDRVLKRARRRTSPGARPRTRLNARRNAVSVS